MGNLNDHEDHPHDSRFPESDDVALCTSPKRTGFLTHRTVKKPGTRPGWQWPMEPDDLPPQTEAWDAWMAAQWKQWVRMMLAAEELAELGDIPETFRGAMSIKNRPPTMPFEVAVFLRRKLKPPPIPSEAKIDEAIKEVIHLGSAASPKKSR